MVFFGFERFKWLFEPIRIDLDQVSAQTLDSGPESWHLGKLGYWGGGPLAESLRCSQELRQKSSGTVKKSFLADVCFLLSQRNNATFF